MDLEQLLSWWSTLDDRQRRMAVAAGVIPPATVALLSGIAQEVSGRGLAEPVGTPPDLIGPHPTGAMPEPAQPRILGLPKRTPSVDFSGDMPGTALRPPGLGDSIPDMPSASRRPPIEFGSDSLFPRPSSPVPQRAPLPRGGAVPLDEMFTAPGLSESQMRFGTADTSIAPRPRAPLSGLTQPAATAPGGSLPPMGPGPGPSGPMPQRPMGFPPMRGATVPMGAMPPGNTLIPGTSPGFSPSVMRMAGMHTQVPEPMTMPLRDVSPQSYLGQATDPFEAIGAQQRAVGGLEAPRIPTPGGPPSAPPMARPMPGPQQLMLRSGLASPGASAPPPSSPGFVRTGYPPRAAGLLGPGPGGDPVPIRSSTVRTGYPPRAAGLLGPGPGGDPVPIRSSTVRTGYPPRAAGLLGPGPGGDPVPIRSSTVRTGYPPQPAGLLGPGGAPPDELTRLVSTPSAGPSALRRLAGSAGRIAGAAGPAITAGMAMAQAGAADPGEEGDVIKDMLRKPKVMEYMPGWGMAMKAGNMALDSGMYDRPAQALGELAGGAGRFLERATRGGPFDFVSGSGPAEPSFDSDPPSALAAPFSPSAPAASAAPSPSPSAPAKGRPSAKVAALQQRMKEAGFDPGEIDGIWGPNTQRAYADYKARGSRAASVAPGPGPRGRLLEALP
jgi:hypothetical protein